MEWSLNLSEASQEWTQEHKNRAKDQEINGTVIEDCMCEYEWIENDECKRCGGSGTEKCKMFHPEQWNQLRLQLVHEKRLKE